MDVVTSGADDALQNQEEDRIQELAARPYQVRSRIFVCEADLYILMLRVRQFL